MNPTLHDPSQKPIPNLPTSITCHEWIQKGAPGYKRLRIRIAGDLGDGVVQLGRLAARGFGMQGYPVELCIHPSAWIRAEPGTKGSHLMVDLSVLVPMEFHNRNKSDPETISGLEDGIDGWIVFRANALPQAFSQQKEQVWVLVDADALSARQLAMPQELPWDSAKREVEIYSLSFLNLPRELDLDRHWRRTQRLLSPREMARCRAFTPLGWIAGRFGLEIGPWDLWIEEHFRNHPPMKDMAQSLLRAGHHSAFGSTAKQNNDGLQMPIPALALLDRGLWKMASGFEALVTGLLASISQPPKQLHIFAPQSPTYAPLLTMAAGLESRGILIHSAESPWAAAWNAWGAWMGGAFTLVLGAGDFRSFLPTQVPFRSGSGLVFLDPEKCQAIEMPISPVIASPSALEIVAKTWIHLEAITSVTHVPSLWNREEPIHLGQGLSNLPKMSHQIALEPKTQETEYISPRPDLAPNGAISINGNTTNGHLASLHSPQKSSHSPKQGWCPGCGNYSILEHLTPYLENGVPVVVLGAPGCAGLLGDWLSVHQAHCPTGAVIHASMGLCHAWPEAMIWVAAGDGELSGPSLGPFLGLVRQNYPVKVLLVNNECAAGAGGVATPISGPLDYHNPGGSPLPLAGLLILAGAGFYARTLDVEVDQLDEILDAATSHRGCAVVEIWQNCRVHNDANHDDLIDRHLAKKHRLDLHQGRPMSYDCDPEKGLIWNSGMLASKSQMGSEPGQFLIHDPTTTQPTLAVALAAMGLNNPTEPTCFGIFVAKRFPSRLPTLAMGGNSTHNTISQAWILPDYPETNEANAPELYFPRREGTL